MNSTVIDNVSFPVVITNIDNHNQIKQPILDAIAMMGNLPAYSSGDVISNTDYFSREEDVNRLYSPIVNQVVIKIVNALQKILNPPSVSIYPGNIWFQQYQKNDHHLWHIHSGYYSSIYYVELPEDTPKTCFRILDKEIEFDVYEGCVLSFPAIAVHQSKPNQSEERKTIISFNTKFK